MTGGIRREIEATESEIEALQQHSNSDTAREEIEFLRAYLAQIKQRQTKCRLRS